MEFLSGFTPLFIAGIFFISFLALLLAGMSAMLNAMLNPIKKDISRLELGQAKLEAKLDQILAQNSNK